MSLSKISKANKLENKRLGEYKLLNRLSPAASEQEIWLAKRLNAANGMSEQVRLQLVTNPGGSPPGVGLSQNFGQFHQVMKLLHHPSIWSVAETGRYEDCLYLVTPYRSEAIGLGKSLEQRNFTPRQALNIAFQVLNSLDFAHRQGVMHGGVSPANILTFPHGPVALANFGLVKFEHDNLASKINKLVTIMPEYMAPEQFMNFGDFRSDLYSVGVLIYRLFVGRVPFEGASMLEAGKQHLNASLPLPQPTIPQPLEQFLVQALQKAPHQRFATAREMIQALDRVVRQLNNFKEPTPLVRVSPPVIMPPAQELKLPTREAVAYSPYS